MRGGALNMYVKKRTNHPSKGDENPNSNMVELVGQIFDYFYLESFENKSPASLSLSLSLDRSNSKVFSTSNRQSCYFDWKKSI